MNQTELLELIKTASQINESAQSSFTQFWETATLTLEEKKSILSQLLQKEISRDLETWIQQELISLLQSIPFDKDHPFFFVSYSSRDWKLVYPIVLQMKLQGANIWIDLELENHGGSNWDKTVKKQLMSSRIKAVLFFISESSFASVPVFQEIVFSQKEPYAGGAINQQPKLIPINTAQCYSQTQESFSYAHIAEILPDTDVESSAQTEFCEIYKKYCDPNFDQDPDCITKSFVGGEFYSRVFNGNNKLKCINGFKPIDIRNNKSFPAECLKEQVLANHVKAQPSVSIPKETNATAQPSAPIPNETHITAQPSVSIPKEPHAETESPASPVERPDSLQVKKVLGNTDIKYNICTFGSKFHVGFGAPVDVVYEGVTYSLKTHNSCKGRIDGFRALYATNNLQLGDVLQANYDGETNTIQLTKM